jgi:hypothetical protein
MHQEHLPGDHCQRLVKVVGILVGSTPRRLASDDVLMMSIRLKTVTPC